VLEDFIHESGTDANVQAALVGYKTGDPMFVNREDTLIMADGEVIGRTEDFEGMDDEEYDKLVTMAHPHALWFEDVSAVGSCVRLSDCQCSLT